MSYTLNSTDRERLHRALTDYLAALDDEPDDTLEWALVEREEIIRLGILLGIDLSEWSVRIHGQC